MADIYVEDADTHQGLSGVWFDHGYYDAGGGYYSVNLDPARGDYRFTCGKSGYNNGAGDIRYVSIVQLTKQSSGGNGGWFR